MKRWQVALGVGAFIILLLYLCFFVFPDFSKASYRAIVKTAGKISGEDTNALVSQSGVTHVPTPSAVKGIYVSACAAATPSFRQKLQHLIETTELNSMVIDIKDFSGEISFEIPDGDLKKYFSTRCPIVDMKEFLENLHEHNIYVIGRITTFQDPFYTKLHPETGVKRKDNGALWLDKNGISYIDPGSRVAWEHVLAIAKASYAIGFDEINFDYIRYPSDGAISNAEFPQSLGRSKVVVMESFFKYLHDNLSGTGPKISADLFGMTTTAEDDMGIGQLLEMALPYFDYVAPMVYPSHYPATFNGWKNPNAVPYDLIKFVMNSAVRRAQATSSAIKLTNSVAIASTSPVMYVHTPQDKNKLRPWIQDFSLGTPPYGAAEVRAQIQATYDIGLTSWVSWNAANKYTAGAYLPQTSDI